MTITRALALLLAVLAAGATSAATDPSASRSGRSVSDDDRRRDGHDRFDRDGYGRGDYDRDRFDRDGYGRGGFARDLGSLATRLETDTDRFQKSVDRALDRSRLDGTRREDDINREVKTFESLTDTLYRNSRRDQVSPRDVEAVLRQGEVVDRIVGRLRLGDQAERDWRRVTDSLDVLERRIGHDSRSRGWNRHDRGRKGGWDRDRDGKRDRDRHDDRDRDRDRDRRHDDDRDDDDDRRWRGQRR